MNVSFGKTQIKRRKTLTSSFDVNCACLSCFVTCFYIRETYFCCIHGWDLTKQIWWWITLHAHLVVSCKSFKILITKYQTIGINCLFKSSISFDHLLPQKMNMTNKQIGNNNISITRLIKTEGNGFLEQHNRRGYRRKCKQSLFWDAFSVTFTILLLIWVQ